ncbi:MAG: hypothetical protein V1875_08795 [Candidatus Altiarchaeota archaeon]
MAGYREIWSLYIGEWSNVYSMVFIPMALLILLELKRNQKLIPAYAATLGLAFMACPQAAIFIVLVFAFFFVLVERPNVGLKDLLLPVILFLLLAYHVFIFRAGMVRLLRFEVNTTQFSLTNMFSLYTPHIGRIPPAFKDVFKVYTPAIIPLVFAGAYFLAKDHKKPVVLFLLIMLFWQYVLNT